MRRHDRPRALERRLIIEQHVPAAIDLNVDEARRKPSARRHLSQHRRRDFGARRHRDDILAIDQDGGITLHSDAVEYIVCRDSVPARRHLVRVTFCKWRGRLTLVPRRAATSIASE